MLSEKIYIISKLKNRLFRRFVDQQVELLVEFGSLKNLWWYPDLIKEDFLVTLAKKYCETPAAKHCMAFVQSSASALENTHPVCPAERAEIGEACVKVARHRLNQITTTIIEAIEYIAHRYQRLNGTHSVVRASFMNAQAPNFPGKESDRETTWRLVLLTCSKLAHPESNGLVES